MPAQERPQGLPKVAALVLRFPFTLATASTILVVGLATGGLWNALQDRSWYPDVAFGLPSLQAGRWWTPITGSMLGATPLDYLPIILGFVLLVGFAELRLGTRWAATVTVTGQIGTVLLTSAVLAVLRTTGWAWAQELARSVDVGFSAGALCAGAVASATLFSPWRQWLRLGLLVYVGVSVLFVGTLSDLEHLLAVGGGLAVTRWVTVPGAAAASGRLSRRQWRLLAVAGLVVLAAISVVVWLAPSRGPMGSTYGLSGSGWQVLILVALLVLLADGLRRGSRVAWWWTVVVAALYALLGLVVAVVFAVGKILDQQVTVQGAAVFVPTAVVWSAELLVLLAGRDAFRARRPRPLLARWRGSPNGAGPAQDTQQRAADLLLREGGGNLSWMTTWPDNTYFFAASQDGYLAYREHAGVAVALGDPVGAPDGRAETIRQFADMCDRAGRVPCLFSATAAAAGITEHQLGWRSVQVAEDTIVDLPDLEFRGKAWQDVRTALNRAKKEGVEYRMGPLAEQPRALLTQVWQISEEWVGDSGLPEMGFTLGGVEEALDPRMRVGLALSGDGRLQGVTSWMPVYEGGAGGDGAGEAPGARNGRPPSGWTLDMMRRRHDGFRPVVEFMIASSCLELREHSAQFLSLSGAPLARNPAAGTPTGLQRILDRLGSAMEPYYGFRSLHAFKAKFQPRYEPMYLLYRDEADLPRIGVALLRCYLPDASVRDLVTATARRG
ncbi:bifunctional lysylphosphatidylglycerol flippase/synthetase MprF [Streptacidiphilus melanogenes]|uniref:bifunctional lysylphosphatidylglycerol flippase/synthetase MprF n=1 Tax=Streptacidiphilus melanogenes TaxID=411235 RepID=UPI0005A9CBF5|nr:DUF2156 domain-containing protein [Streptacidiphilus melanogenes]